MKRRAALANAAMALLGGVLGGLGAWTSVLAIQAAEISAATLVEFIGAVALAIFAWLTWRSGEIKEIRERRAFATALLAELFPLTRGLKKLAGGDVFPVDMLESKMIDRAANHPGIFDARGIELIGWFVRDLGNVRRFLEMVNRSRDTARQATNPTLAQKANKTLASASQAVVPLSALAFNSAVELVDELQRIGGQLPSARNVTYLITDPAPILSNDPFAELDLRSNDEAPAAIPSSPAPAPTAPAVEPPLSAPPTDSSRPQPPAGA